GEDRRGVLLPPHPRQILLDARTPIDALCDQAELLGRACQTGSLRRCLVLHYKNTFETVFTSGDSLFFPTNLMIFVTKSVAKHHKRVLAPSNFANSEIGKSRA